MGAFGQVVIPLLLKDVHGWQEEQIGHVFNVAGLCTLAAHMTLTAWLSSRSWRARAMQALSLLVGCAVLGIGMLGQRSAAAAFVLFVVAYVATAVCLGIGNLMIALFAQAVAPEALAALTGLARCLFMAGFAALPATIVPLQEAGGLMLPCAVVAILFAIKALLLQAAATPVSNECVVVAPPAEMTEARAMGMSMAQNSTA